MDRDLELGLPPNDNQVGGNKNWRGKGSASEFPKSNGNDIVYRPDGPEAAPVVAENHELKHWSFYRAVIAEFMATLLLLYVGLTAYAGASRTGAGTLGTLEVAWAFGGMIFILVYCIAGLSGIPLSCFMNRPPFLNYVASNKFTEMAFCVVVGLDFSPFSS